FHYGGGCAYYITICAHEKRMLFGFCEGGVVSLTELGTIVSDSWLATESLRSEAVLDEFIVMPNHMHAILHVSVPAGDGTLFRIVGGFKSHVTSAAREMFSDHDLIVWQRRFNDRVIRSGAELERFREYIRSNPARWSAVDEGPARRSRALHFYKLP